MADLEIVWVPGHLCGAWLYAPQIADLPGPHRVARVDLDDTVAAMADRLLAEAPERFVIAGLSMGGMVAMEAMARAPGRLAGAVVIATDPNPAREKEVAWRAGRVAKAGVEGLAAYSDGFAAKFFAHDPRATARLEAETQARMAETPLSVAEAQARALDTRRAMLPLIEGFAAPVEVIVGAEDRVCPASLHPPIAAACADAVLTTLPRTGHLVTVEAPEAVTERVHALLRRALRRAPV